MAESSEIIADVDSSFIAGGFARSNYQSSRLWRDAYASLEPLANEFQSDVWTDTQEGYKWRTDPLRWWSRRWEYPWVAAQLNRIQSSLSSRPAALDVGAAVTFFSFYLAQLGFELTNLDNDESMARS